MNRDPKRPAFAAVTVALLAWSLGPIHIRMLTPYFDQYTINVVRYEVAAAPLLLASLIWFRDDLFKLFRSWRMMGTLVALTIVMQMVWTAGIYGSTANLSQLITKISVVFTIGIAWFVFRDEREVIRDPRFVLGVVLSFAGLVMVMAKEPGSLAPVFDTAAWFLIATAVLWAIYNVWSKYLVETTAHPIPLFGVQSFYAGLGFLPFALLFGDPGSMFDLSAKMATIAVLSGLLPLGIAHPCYNYAQMHLGASYCGTLVLFTPAGTYLLSAIFLPEESLRPLQLAGAGVLILGTVAVTLAHRRVVRPRVVESITLAPVVEAGN